MKFESLFLRGLFAACVLLCGWTLAAMVTASPVPANHAFAAAASSASFHARAVG